MSISEINGTTTGPLMPSAAPAPESLTQRLQAEIDTARERVEALQTEAGRDFMVRSERLLQFADAADRIHLILQSRVENLAGLTVFQDLAQHTGVDSPASLQNRCQTRITSLTLPASASRPATMTCSFRVGHDQAGKQLILDYRLDVQPVFMKFQSQDQLVLPIAEIPEDTAAGWIEEKLVGFTKTYFEIFFHDEYQKKCLVPDPVLNIRFPQGMAVGTQHYRGRAYYFYTEHSSQLFRESPEEYAKAE